MLFRSKEPLAPGSEFEQLASIKVTSVSRSDSTVQQSPAAVFVITSDMIRRSGATAIPELLRMVPGMNVARIDGNKWAVSARGLNTRFEDKLLVQIDGRTVYNPVFSGVYWDTQDYPMEDIERIEVIRGPGASVWGANAVNGIISVVTKPAADTQGGLVSVAGGTVDDTGTIQVSGSSASLGTIVTIQLNPSLSAGGRIAWLCTTGGSATAGNSSQWKYVPAECRH